MVADWREEYTGPEYPSHASMSWSSGEHKNRRDKGARKKVLNKRERITDGCIIRVLAVIVRSCSVNKESATDPDFAGLFAHKLHAVRNYS